MNDPHWHLTWHLTPHPEGIGESDLPLDHGACDAAILISILKSPDGEQSQVLASMDGQRGSRLTPEEFFQAWLAMGRQLSQMSEMKGVSRAFAFRVCEMAQTLTPLPVLPPTEPPPYWMALRAAHPV